MAITQPSTDIVTETFSSVSMEPVSWQTLGVEVEYDVLESCFHITASIRLQRFREHQNRTLWCLAIGPDVALLLDI